MGKEGKGRGGGRRGKGEEGKGNICRTNVKLLPAPLGHQLYGPVGYCPQSVQEYLAIERQTWKKQRQITPSPPQKKGSSGQCNICSYPAM